MQNKQDTTAAPNDGVKCAEKGKAKMETTNDEKTNRKDEVAPEGFINKKEIARRAGKKIRTIDNWMRFRRIPYIKIGGSVLFDWGQVKSHIAEHFTVNPRSN